VNIARWPLIVAAALLFTPARIDGITEARDLINGATIEIFYNTPTVDNRVLPVRMLSEGREQTRVSVDFSRIQ
jgi:hypothetical protein